MKNDETNQRQFDAKQAQPDMKEENMTDFAHKWLKGIVVISLVGVLSYAFLFVLMWLI